MKLNRKGYTLIELLAVILIIGLILGFSTYGIINAFNTSKNKSLTISINSIKEAAETYATEKNDDSSYWLDITDKDITDKIRTNEISMAASNVSKLSGVRSALVAAQRKIAASKGYILDGRDICDVVLPDAEVKVFLTASAEDRARRRLEQNKEKGIIDDYDEILEEIKKRDYQDSHRAISPLKASDDATIIDSSDKSIDEVVNMMLDLVYKKI